MNEPSPSGAKCSAYSRLCVSVWFLASKIKEILLIVWYIKFFQKRQVLLSERSLSMMFLLVLDVADDFADLRVPVRKRTKALLPAEPPRKPTLAIDEVRRVGLHLLHQV